MTGDTEHTESSTAPTAWLGPVERLVRPGGRREQRMPAYRVTFEIELPDTVSDDEAEEFISFGIGSRGDMDMNNPLAYTDLQSCKVSRVTVDKA